MANDNDITSIPLKKTTRDQLRTKGAKGDTYDDIILELLKRK